MTIGEKIREIRESKEMSQMQIANICNMSRQQINAIEFSDGYPRIQTLIKIAKALGCPLRDLLNEPLQLGLLDAPRVKETEYPCANSDRCPFFQKKE